MPAPTQDNQTTAATTATTTTVSSQETTGDEQKKEDEKKRSLTPEKKVKVAKRIVKASLFIHSSCILFLISCSVNRYLANSRFNCEPSTLRLGCVNSELLYRAVINLTILSGIRAWLAVTKVMID